MFHFLLSLLLFFPIIIFIFLLLKLNFLSNVFKETFTLNYLIRQNINLPNAFNKKKIYKIFFFIFILLSFFINFFF